jgi:hypothetical protein
VWLCIPRILALRLLQQEEHEFEVTLGYRAKPCLTNLKRRRETRGDISLISCHAPVSSWDYASKKAIAKCSPQTCTRTKINPFFKLTQSVVLCYEQQKTD